MTDDATEHCESSLQLITDPPSVADGLVPQLVSSLAEEKARVIRESELGYETTLLIGYLAIWVAWATANKLR